MGCVQEPSLPCLYRGKIREIEWTDIGCEEGGPRRAVEIGNSVHRINDNVFDKRRVVPWPREIIGGNVPHEFLVTVVSDRTVLDLWKLHTICDSLSVHSS